MQSSTSMVETGLHNCFVEIGKWAYPKAGRAREVYSELYGIYLTEGTATSATPTAAARPQRTTRTPRQAAQTQPAANTPAPRQRTRSASGTPGPKDAQVLAKIVATPGIAIEPLRRYFENPARKMSTNILGTSISRLMKAGLITGTPKVGPFTATPPGVEAVKKVTSINTRRRASSKATTGATTTESVQEQAAATG